MGPISGIIARAWAMMPAQKERAAADRPSGSALSRNAFAPDLAVLTDHERGTPPGHAKHQTQGTKIAIFDPEVIRLDVLEHLSDQAALLGMPIFGEKDISNQHPLLIQDYQRMAG